MPDRIETDAELDAAIAECNALIDRHPDLSADERARLDALGDRIFEYEERTNVMGEDRG